MKPGLKPGDSAGFEIVVTDQMRPSFDDRIVHDVLSTVSMIYYMEKAGRQIIFPYLQSNEEGAGYAIDIKHMGPAVVGQIVKFQAICTEVTPRRVVCEVIAQTDIHTVGKGYFTQAIFLKEQMVERIQTLKQNLLDSDS
jgi:fluoroacetyl-CoA thioesterase